MSTTKTNVGPGQGMFVQAAGLFAQSMQRSSTLGRMSGPMPKGEAGAASVIRRQTNTDMPVVKTVDLGRGTGDEVEFHFVQPKGAYPIMGSRMAEGKGTGINYDKQRVRVNQARFPIDLGDNMTTIRSPIEFRKLGRPIAQSFMDTYLDQATLVHMAGARGFQDNIEWRVPVEAHEKFAEIMVNPVKAPTRNRHYMADADNGIQGFAISGGEVDIQTTDVLDMQCVDSIRTLMESIALPPPAIRLPDDPVADDSPLRMLLVSPAQYQAFAQDKDFRQFQANALARANKAKNHPLFLGEVGLWNGVLIAKMPKPIRFYAGDPIRYSASYTSEAESVATVPASFGTTHAVDRAILLGGQALAQAFAASKHGGMPFFWKEKTFDHDDKEELLIGGVMGMEKIRWNVQRSADTMEITDHGVIAIDTAVKVIGPRL